MEQEEKFSEDPEEQLRIENELLKLKMQAELGAVFSDNKNLPPEVEQEFLKQVQAFHDQQQHAPLIKVRDLLNIAPPPTSSDQLSAEALPLAWEQLELQLNEKNLQVIFSDEIDEKTRYDFVVNELFELEIMKPAAGTNWIFDYEEFHPDHIKDMARRTEEFINDFFRNSITEEAPFLARELVTPGGKTISIQDLLHKIQLFHDLFSELKSYDYKIEDTHMEAAQEPDSALTGTVEGAVRYAVITEAQEEQEMFGPFRLSFRYANGWWEITGFSIQGFSMD